MRRHHKDVRIGWVFSLIRSGSSATAYGAAVPWGYAIADEPLGPWVRTGPEYGYPPVQAKLVRAFADAGWRLSPRVVRLARRFFDRIGAESGGVVSKHPHLDFEPEEFKACFPSHGSVHILRNPLHRLNSIHARALEGQYADNHDLDRYTAFAKRWLRMPEGERLLFDDLKRDPKGYYRAIFEAWRWQYEEADIDAAAAYTSKHYHASCKELEGSDPTRPISEAAAMLPDEAIDLYLSDPFIVDLMRECNWPVEGDAYRRLVAGATA